MQERRPQQIGSGARKLLHYAAQHKISLVFSSFCILAANVLRAAGPVVLQRAVDNLAAGGAKIVLLRYTALFIAIAFIQGVLLFGQEQLWLGASRQFERELRSAFFAHLQTLPLKFFQANPTGDLMARASNDLSLAVTGTSEALMFSLDSVFSLVIILPLMLKLDWKLTFLAFAPLLAVILATLVFQEKIRTGFERVQEHFGVLSVRIQSVLSAAKTIRAFGQENNEMAAFQRASREYVAHNLRRVRLSSAFFPFLQFFVGLSFIAVLWYGGELTVSGKLTIGQFLEFIVYLGYLAWPMYVLSWQITVFQRGMVAMGRVESILSLPSAIQDSSEALDVKEIEGSIEFRNVTFKYKETGEPTLRNISFRIEPGQMVGLLGAVGSGKSTLMNMIPRLLDPSSGKIFIDGNPVHEIPLRVLRSQIGYVPQETFLFSETIAANIAFGSDEASPEAIERIADECGIAAEIAAFPRGYKTMVGERGATLSGGQRQRISIARALLNRPAILLLDDAFSSVDSYTEEKVLARVRKIMLKKTCFIASHRISALKDADRIIVLHEGTIIEQGTHHELLARRGLYSEMHAMHLLEEDLAAS